MQIIGVKKNSNYVANSPKNIFIFYTSLIFGNASERVIFPVLALVFFDLHSHLLPSDTGHAIRSYWYGLCVALPSLANFIAAPILSCSSDYFGRKKLLVVSYAGTFFAGIITSTGILTQEIQLFALGMFVQGMFSRTNPIAQAVVGDVSSGREKLVNIGWVQTIIAFGAFLGPIIGGYFALWHFDHFNFSIAFIFSALFSLVAALVCFLFFKETLLEPQKHFTVALVFGSIMILKQRRTALLAAILSCEQFTWSFYYQYVPPAVKLAAHFSAVKLGLFVGLLAFWVMLGGAVIIRLLRMKLDVLQTLTTALVLQLLGGVCVLIALEYNFHWMIWLSSVPSAVGDVIAFSVISTMYSNTYGQDQQGQVMGACFFNAAAIWSITALLGGYLLSFNEFYPLVVAPLAIVVALVLQRYLYWEFK